MKYISDLHDVIDGADEGTVKECLKQIVELWFVEHPGGDELDTNLEINADTIASIADVLAEYGFWPTTEAESDESFMDEEDE